MASFNHFQRKFLRKCFATFNANSSARQHQL